MVRLIPLLAWRGAAVADRRHLLHTQAGSVAGDAAASTLAAGTPGLAVELLDQGRGVLWAQLLDTRTDLGRLDRAHPGLAQRLRECRAVLDTGAAEA